jgi:hypothetical protein
MEQNELIVSKEELHKMFVTNQIKDTCHGWYYQDKEIDIYAIHNVETKYITNIMEAQYYKIVFKE